MSAMNRRDLCIALSSFAALAAVAAEAAAKSIRGSGTTAAPVPKPEEEDVEMKDATSSAGESSDDNKPVDKVSLETATQVALAAAAMKAKELADIEDLEVRRLAAYAIELQLNKVQHKLEIFQAMESMVIKERRKVEEQSARLVHQRMVLKEKEEELKGKWSQVDSARKQQLLQQQKAVQAAQMTATHQQMAGSANVPPNASHPGPPMRNSMGVPGQFAASGIPHPPSLSQS